MTERFPIGALVRTLADDGSDDWTEQGREERACAPRGIEGYVREFSDRHGLCYRVWHIEYGSTAWYNHSELQLVQPDRETCAPRSPFAMENDALPCGAYWGRHLCGPWCPVHEDSDPCEEKWS